MQSLRISRIDKIILWIAAVMFAVIWLLPLIVLIQRSLNIGGIENYLYILTQEVGGTTLPQTLLNSGTIAAIHAIGVTVVSTLSGFAFSKLSFTGRNVFYSITVSLLCISGMMIFVPLYRILNFLNIRGSLLGVGLAEIVFTVPFGVLMLRHHFDSISNEYMEASMIDGANLIEIFRYIYLPLSRPAVINLGALCVMWSFQDYVLPLLFITSPSLTPASNAVFLLKNSLTSTPLSSARWSAAMVVIALPAIFLAIFGLRFISQGLTSGGVKE